MVYFPAFSGTPKSSNIAHLQVRKPMVLGHPNFEKHPTHIHYIATPQNDENMKPTRGESHCVALDGYSWSLAP